MIFNIHEEEGKYANKNLINADIIHDQNTLKCHFYFGKDYERTFGNQLFEQFEGKPLVEIKLVIDNANTRSLMVNKNDEMFDKDSDVYDENASFIPISDDTPIEYRYRMSGFYVLVKEFLKSEDEKMFFRGIGHSLLCWILSEANLGKNCIFAIEASGSRTAEQEGLVKYYTSVGFKTCGDISNVPKEWYKSFSGTSICMYSTIENLYNICSMKQRTFKTTGQDQNPFRTFKDKEPM